VLINVNENDFKEDITSFNEFQKIYLVQYRKIVNLGDLSRLSAQLIVPRIAIKSSIFARFSSHGKKDKTESVNFFRPRPGKLKIFGPEPGDLYLDFENSKRYSWKPKSVSDFSVIRRRVYIYITE